LCDIPQRDISTKKLNNNAQGARKLAIRHTLYVSEEWMFVKTYQAIAAIAPVNAQWVAPFLEFFLIARSK
jgi:hypothetical protein